MNKWFQACDIEKSCIIASRIRLVRNWKNYKFPMKLSIDESKVLVTELEKVLSNLEELDQIVYERALLSELSDLDKKAMVERKLINHTIASKKTATGIMVSESENCSIVLNGSDHIRIQMLERGMKLKEMWEKVNQIDNYINERIDYAFDLKYGYLTAYPTNVGTGLRASVILHLPNLSMSKRFQGLVSEMSRFGAAIKGVFGNDQENYGCLYEVSNQKSLGSTESEIVDLVMRVANQLSMQEMQMKKLAVEKRELERKDEAYKSYGVLKYARKLSIKEGMTFLSQILSGEEEGLLTFTQPESVYSLMLGIQEGNLLKLSKRPLSKMEIAVARAQYLRKELPKLK